MVVSPVSSPAANPALPLWAKAIAQPAEEFGPSPLLPLEGQIPMGLSGTLYFNGPGRLSRGGQRVGHWFDGDGAILAVQFDQGQAIARYRYVRSAGYLAEEAAGRYLFGNYGMSAPGPWWQRLGKPLKNAANTSVLALEDRLLALWEGDRPHRLDLETLETLGLDSLAPHLPTAPPPALCSLPLQPGETYSAHPKIDPLTGDIYNFGIQPGARSWLHLYRSDRRGRIRQRNRLPLPRISLIHDFVLAGPYLVFCIPPLKLDLWPALLGHQSFSEALRWRPQHGTQVWLIDRQSLTLVAQTTLDPWFQWHFANGYTRSDGAIVLDLVCYEDSQTNQYLREIALGQTQTPVHNQLQRLILQPQLTQNSLSQLPIPKASSLRLLDRFTLIPQTCEFPQIAPQWVGQAAPRTYVAARRPECETGEELLGCIGAIDHQGDRLDWLDCGAQHYVGEPVYVPCRRSSEQISEQIPGQTPEQTPGQIPGQTPEHDCLLSLVYNGPSDRSELWLIHAQDLSRGPLCRLQLPRKVPLGFHGTWRPRSKGI